MWGVGWLSSWEGVGSMMLHGYWHRHRGAKTMTMPGVCVHFHLLGRRRGGRREGYQQHQRYMTLAPVLSFERVPFFLVLFGSKFWIQNINT